MSSTPTDTTSPTILDQSPVIKRPANKHRKSAALRTSFTPSSFEDDEEPSSVVLPKRSNLSRIAPQRHAEKRPAPDLAFRPPIHDDPDRPSYSKDYLDELKQSTPSTPKDQAFRDGAGTIQSGALALDIASKFGADLSRYQPPTAIPTDAEIQEKKERRSRLAKEQNYISLDQDQDEQDDEDDDNVTRDDQGRLILKPKEKYPETRLVRDDEDMLEGFDEFTSTDARIGFGSATANLEAAKRRKAEMASLIANAEGRSDDDTEDDDSEAERNAAFELAQTRHGNYAAKDDDEHVARPQTPPRIAPLSTLDAVVERLRKRLEEMELLRMGKMQEMQRLVDEKASINEEEVRVQAALKETGERYSRLREELRSQQEDHDNRVANGSGTRPVDSDHGDGFDERPALGLGSVESVLKSPHHGLEA
ncbi:nineteen complex-related protein 2-domain-containing protein [Delphinella strobiligena]|nr:nineteen complex-related protein 2-domain-containing protein [Delphinella strobiligena]